MAYKDQSATPFVDHLLIFDGSENSSNAFSPFGPKVDDEHDRMIRIETTGFADFAEVIGMSARIFSLAKVQGIDLL